VEGEAAQEPQGELAAQESDQEADAVTDEADGDGADGDWERGEQAGVGCAFPADQGNCCQAAEGRGGEQGGAYADVCRAL